MQQSRKRICTYVVPPVAECIWRVGVARVGKVNVVGRKQVERPPAGAGAGNKTHGTIMLDSWLLMLRYTRLTAIADPCAGA